MTAILMLLKNKFVIYALILLCCIFVVAGFWYRGSYYEHKIADIKTEHEAQKVAMYEAFAKQTELHNERLVEIEKVSKETQNKIKNLRLQNEKCQNADFYNTANSIIDELR